MTAQPWQCATCHRIHPVPSRARQCERKHQQQEEDL